jgi:ATP-dependent DNA helicase PIF1
MISTRVIVGPAGSGKSHMLREAVKNDPSYAVLTALTGVAAVNLGEGVTTVHSQLKFYDLASLRYAYEQGFLRSQFLKLSKRRIKYLVIDEISMLSADHLVLIYRAACDAARQIEAGKLRNEIKYSKMEPVGLILTGDFMQLPPVTRNGEAVKFAFQAECWTEFNAGLEKLTTQYRQTDPDFLNALQAARQGRGIDCAMLLKKCGIRYIPEPDPNFDGVTLFATNAQVNKYNGERLARLDGEEVSFTARQWGKPAGEWKEIPDVLTVKSGALVMVLVNETTNFTYANGDLALVRNSGTRVRRVWKLVTNREGEEIRVPEDFFEKIILGDERALPLVIDRNQSEIALSKIVRGNKQSDLPPDVAESIDWEGPEPPRDPDFDPDGFWPLYFEYMEQNQMRGVPYFEPLQRGWIIGEINYMPVRLGYALTVHKAQGLTLDRVQIDARPHPAGAPGLMYVALSRARGPEGLTVVGNPSLLARRINVAPEVREWA